MLIIFMSKLTNDIFTYQEAFMKNQVKWLFLVLVLLATPNNAYTGYSQKVTLSFSGEVFYLAFDPDKGSHSILTRSQKSESSSIYYSTSGQSNCNIDSISLDYGDKRVAYCELCSNPPSYRIIIIDKFHKKQIISFDNGGPLFSFSPKGDAIVFSEEIPGEPGTPSPPSYRGGVWLYDFAKKKEQKIEIGNAGIRDLNWSEHDGNIYVATYSDILRYDVKYNKVEKVFYKGIYFSPDAKYYARVPNEGESRLYNTIDNAEIMELKKSILLKYGIDSNPFPVFQFWSKKLNAVIMSIAYQKYIIYDPEINKILGEFNGIAIGTNSDGTLVAIHPPGKDGRSKVEILNLLDLIQPKSGP